MPRAPSLRWGALFLSGAVAALLPPAWQAAYAAGVIAVLGLPHGAADLALVPAERRSGFLLAYLGAIAATVLLWRVDPALALAGFLLLSLVHFAMDGAGGAASPRSWAIAAALLGGPALCHRGELTAILDTLAGDQAARIVATLFAIGIVATPIAIAAAFRKTDGSPRGIALVALVFVVAAPPLVGFALGFVALHADRQTRLRRDALGLAGDGAYLRKVAPVLAATVPVVMLLAIAVPPSPAGVRLLFVALSALAVPHMLVTPLWTGAEGPILPGWPSSPRRQASRG